MATRADFEKIISENQDDFEGAMIPVDSFGRFLVKITAEAVVKSYTEDELEKMTVEEAMIRTFANGMVVGNRTI